MIDATSATTAGQAAAAAASARSLYTSSTATSAPKQTMDKEVFLSLLVAQLRNQDPSSPMDTNEMLAQSTQLASMEQLTALADTSRENFSLQMRMAAIGLVGQEVTFTDADGVSRTGTASGVSFAGPVPAVTIGTGSGALSAPLDAVSAIRASSPPAAPAVPTTPTTPAASSSAA